jgi:hypothetical protein
MEITKKRLIVGLLLGIVLLCGCLITLARHSPVAGLATGSYCIFLGWFVEAKLKWLNMGIQGMVIGAVLVLVTLFQFGGAP